MQKVVSIRIGDDRGLSDVVAISFLMLLAISLAGVVYLQADDVVGEVDQQPEAQIVSDPGATEMTLVVDELENADELYIRVNGNDARGVAGSESLSASVGSSVTLGDADDGADIDVESVDETAWDGFITSGTNIAVVAISSTGDERVVFEYRQP